MPHIFRVFVALLTLLGVSSVSPAHPGHVHRKAPAESEHSNSREQVSTPITVDRNSLLSPATDSKGTHHAIEPEILAAELWLVLQEAAARKIDGREKTDLETALAFDALVEQKAIRTRWDNRYFYCGH